MERFDEAEAAYRKAIELNPGYTWAWTNLGRLLHEKLERYEEAEAAYRKAIELDPSYDWAWAQLGRLMEYLGAIGQWKEAIDIALRFLSHTDRAENLVGQLTDFFINAAASGYAEDVLTLLEKNPGASILEPLVAGLHIFLGEEPIIAQEIARGWTRCRQKNRNAKTANIADFCRGESVVNVYGLAEFHSSLRTMERPTTTIPCNTSRGV